MKRVLTAVVLIPVVLLVVFRAPLWLFALAVGSIVVLALHEYLNLAKGYGLKPAFARSYVLAAFLIWAMADSPGPNVLSPLGQILWLIVLLFPLLFGIQEVFRTDLKTALPDAAVSAFGVLYIAGSLGLLISLRADPARNVLIIFILFTVWAGDTAAYYIGKNFGIHKLAPVVSPGKTWEGAVASVVASAAVGAVIFHFHDLIGSQFRGGYLPLAGSSAFLYNVIFVSVCTNIAAQFGDLYESAIKRGAHVKDSGSLLPGHGGILDRIDALLFAIPFVWYYAALFHFPPVKSLIGY